MLNHTIVGGSSSSGSVDEGMDSYNEPGNIGSTEEQACASWPGDVMTAIPRTVLDHKILARAPPPPPSVRGWIHMMCP